MFKIKLKGATTRETLENVSYLLIIISAIAVAIGIGLGSFVAKTVYIAVAGAALFLPAIALFIISQLLEKPEQKAEEKA